MQPLGVRGELVRQVAIGLEDAGGKLSPVELCLYQKGGSGSDLGEYGGAADQYTKFCDAWLAETRLILSATSETVIAMRAAADEYDKTDASASLRVAEAAQPVGY